MAEILADPVTKLMMRRDGVTEEQVRRLLRQAAAARRTRLPGYAASGQVIPLAAASRSGS